MTLTPRTETADQAMIDAAKAAIAECATPESVRGVAHLWRDGNDTMDRHDPSIGTWLCALVQIYADDIAAGCARSVANQRQLDARRRRRQSAKQRVRVLAGGRPARRPQADHPTTHLYLQPLA